MSEHEWKFGDWAREKSTGFIVRFLGIGDGSAAVMFKDASIGKRAIDGLEYLPDCTGFDWRPIEPPEGYRILGRQEIVQSGDKYKSDRHDRWFDATVFGDTVERLKASSTKAYSRKINRRRATNSKHRTEPQYRPFANAAEFAPHRERWVKWKTEPLIMRVHSYRDGCLWIGSATSGQSFEEALEQLTFEHGEPFGVENK